MLHHPLDRYTCMFIKFQISHHFDLRPAISELQAILSAPKGQRYPYTCYNYHRVPNSTPFRSTVCHFRVTGHFDTSAPNDPPLRLNTERSKVPICIWQLSQSPKFQSVSLYSHSFGVAGHFETRAPNNPKMTLNTISGQVNSIYLSQSPPSLSTKRAEVLHLHITTRPDSQISFSFALQPADFKLHSILRNVHQMTPK